MKNIAAFAIILLVTIINVNNAEKNECGQTEKLDQIIQRLYLWGAEDRKYPTTKTEMKEFCSSSTEYQNWLNKYKDKCLKNLSKQLLGLMMYSVSKNTKAICKSPKRAAEFLVIGTCGNAAKVDTIKCWNNLTREVNKANYHTDEKLKIPLVCCNYYKFKTCNEKAFEANPGKCSAKAVDGHEKLINSFALETLKLLCSDYVEDSDKCDKIPDTFNKVVELKVLPKSPINLVIKIFESLRV